MNQSGRPRQIRCVRVTGVVQGVGFRPFVVKLAKSCNLRGSVSNKGSFVEIILQGDEFTFETFISRLKNEKPPLSVIDAIEISTLDPLDHLLTDFVVVDSVPSSSLTTSYIPPDMAMCDRCLTDMTRGDRAERKRYPFTSCVDCGPRFTIIRSLPYDRRTTAMKDFPLCQECEIEYNGLEDRRYQAQTTCCSTCGPRYTLYDSDRNPITTSDEEIAGLTSRLLTEGSIVAVKGIGGTHLACEATSDTPTNRLRKSKGDRKRKPFAIMSKNIKEIRKFAVIEFDWIEELLLSPQRPIVLLPKRHPFTLSSEISPGLHNVGVMLPYAGIHHLLLEHPQMSNFVMTSANRSHLPIQINNNLIFSDLKGVADYFLLHNRTIDQRADDSVIKPLIQLTECTGKQNSVFIRRSRGFTPMPISIDDWEWDHAIVGLSSELHTAAAIAFRKRLFLTQYVGSLHYQESQEFLVSAITHLRKLFQNPTIEALVGDLHPGYYSTELGRQLADQLGIPFIQVQHHFAHAASLLGEHSINNDKAVVFASDGLGYGTDGAIWGGEFLAGNIGNFERVSHWDYVRQPGGDVATRFPGRMALSYLYKAGITTDELRRVKRLINTLPNIDVEAEIVFRQIESGTNSPLTSSTGRFLDAVACLLGLIAETSYEGEPAIVLEGVAWHSKQRTNKKAPDIVNPLLDDLSMKNFPPTDLSKLFLVIYENLIRGMPRADLAYHCLSAVAELASRTSIELARKFGNVKYIGITGGVAYNDIISSVFVKNVLEHGYTPLVHRKVPPGDGGIAAGQLFHFAAISKNR